MCQFGEPTRAAPCSVQIEEQPMNTASIRFDYRFSTGISTLVLKIQSVRFVARISIA